MILFDSAARLSCLVQEDGRQALVPRAFTPAVRLDAIFHREELVGEGLDDVRVVPRGLHQHHLEEDDL